MDAQLLAEVSLFEGLPEDDRIALAERTDEFFLAPEGILFYEGQVASSLYLIRRGSVQVTKSVCQDNQIRVDIGTLGPGSVIGEMSLVGSKGRSCTICALEKTEFLVLPIRELKAFCEERPGSWERILQNIVGILTQRLDSMNAILSRKLAEEPKNTLVRALLGMS